MNARTSIEPTKLYFRIGEVAAIVGVEPHVLRYWEREFRMIRPTKSAKGQRVYSRRDLENLLRVRGLLYDEGFTIAGAKRKLQRKNGHDAGDTGAASEPRDDAEDSPEGSPLATPILTGSSLEDSGQAGSVETGAEPEAAPAADGARQTLVDLRSEIEAFLTSEEWSRA